MYFYDMVVAYFSGESSTGAAAIAPQRRDSSSITRRGVSLFLFFPSWQENMCNWLFFLNNLYLCSAQKENIAFGSARHLMLSLADSCQTQTHLTEPPYTLLPNCISLFFSAVFVKLLQQYFQTVARPASTLPIQRGSLLALPGPASYVAFMAASANVPEMQSRCGQQAFPIYSMTHHPIVI